MCGCSSDNETKCGKHIIEFSNLCNRSHHLSDGVILEW